jgi:hypothetical protein
MVSSRLARYLDLNVLYTSRSLLGLVFVMNSPVAKKRK